MNNIQMLNMAVLLSVPGVGPKTLLKLEEAGVLSLAAIHALSVKNIKKVVGNQKTADSIKEFTSGLATGIEIEEACMPRESVKNAGLMEQTPIRKLEMGNVLDQAAALGLGGYKTATKKREIRVVVSIRDEKEKVVVSKKETSKPVILPEMISNPDFATVAEILGGDQALALETIQECRPRNEGRGLAVLARDAGKTPQERIETAIFLAEQLEESWKRENFIKKSISDCHRYLNRCDITTTAGQVRANQWNDAISILANHLDGYDWIAEKDAKALTTTYYFKEHENPWVNQNYPQILPKFRYPCFRSGVNQGGEILHLSISTEEINVKEENPVETPREPKAGEQQSHFLLGKGLQTIENCDDGDLLHNVVNNLGKVRVNRWGQTVVFNKNVRSDTYHADAEEAWLDFFLETLEDWDSVRDLVAIKNEITRMWRAKAFRFHIYKTLMTEVISESKTIDWMNVHWMVKMNEENLSGKALVRRIDAVCRLEEKISNWAIPGSSDLTPPVEGTFLNSEKVQLERKVKELSSLAFAKTPAEFRNILLGFARENQKRLGIQEALGIKSDDEKVKPLLKRGSFLRELLSMKPGYAKASARRELAIAKNELGSLSWPINSLEYSWNNHLAATSLGCTKDGKPFGDESSVADDAMGKKGIAAGGGDVDMALQTKGNTMAAGWDQNEALTGIDEALEIDGIGQATIDRLKAEGFETLEEINALDVQSLHFFLGNRARALTLWAGSAKVLQDDRNLQFSSPEMAISRFGSSRGLSVGASRPFHREMPRNEVETFSVSDRQIADWERGCNDCGIAASKTEDLRVEDFSCAVISLLDKTLDL